MSNAVLVYNNAAVTITLIAATFRRTALTRLEFGFVLVVLAISSVVLLFAISSL